MKDLPGTIYKFRMDDDDRPTIGGPVSWPPIWTLPTILLATSVVLLRYWGSSAWNLGDGALHYLQARWAPHHAHLFFDRWAKPVFVVIGTGFAQFGPLGLVILDALVAAATAICIVCILGQGRRLAVWLVPIMLFFSIQYFTVVISGLTEPLFGLISILCVLLLLRGRYMASMALLSFTPFIRPEWVVLLPVLVSWAVLHRQWRALPVLALGPFLYAVTGWLVLKGRFLYFAKDPYQGSTLYPPGPWDHFVTQASIVLGEPLLAMAWICLPVLIVLYLRDKAQRANHLAILVLAVLPTIGIWAVHSYAYWAGGHASAGLLRVLATATPLTVLFVAYTLLHGTRRWLGHRQALALGLVTIGYLVWAQDDLRFRIPLPSPANTEQRMVETAVADAMAHARPGGRMGAVHPYFSVVADIDPWEGSNGGTDATRVATLEIGDLFEWDREYAAPGTAPVEDLLADDRLSVVAMHGEGMGWRYPPLAFWVFQRSSIPQAFSADTLADLVGRPTELARLWNDPFPCPDDIQAVLCGLESEFPLTFNALPVSPDSNTVLAEWILVLDLEATEVNGSTGLVAACSVAPAPGQPSIFYEEEGLVPGANAITFRLGGSLLDKTLGLMIWNKGHRPYKIKALRLVRRCRYGTSN